MSNVNANINVFVNTKQAQAQISALQAQITAFNKGVVSSSSAAAAQQASMNKALMDGAIASKMFTAKMMPVVSSVDSFTNSLEKNKFSLGQYTRYAASQMPGMSRIFKKEFETISRVAESNVRRLQTQFTAAGDAANGMNRAIALTPRSLDKLAAGQAVANQRAMIFNRLMRDGTTSLLNYGKNTQWAGRQLMVGFTIPLGIFAGIAAKTFKELEAQAIAFKKVYGDIFTTPAEVEQNLTAVKELSLELTKYGLAVSKTMELANIAAQAGLRDADLLAATNEATRLAVLGQMEQAEAMQTVISMQTAFGQSNEELADSVNFLNIIENQTVLSLQDVAGAIPRVAPVIKGMGGDVKDLAVLLVAMKEGGVSAAEGANALKNSLARLITPTAAASKMAKSFGINLESMVSRNKGEVLPLILELAEAMESLDGLDQQKLLSTVFGKYQFARIGTLMNNIVKDTSQARRAMDLMGMSTEDLAKTAEEELGVVENSVSTKFTAALEKAKFAIAPIGEQFLKALTPVLDFVSKVFEKFNSMPDSIKNAIAVFVGIIGGIAPVLLMTIGLIANLVANGLKFMNVLRSLSARLKGNGSQFNQMAIAEQEAAIASASLEGRVGSLTGKMVMQQGAISTLIGLYSNLASAAAKAASSMPLAMGVPGARIGSRSVVSGSRTGGTSVSGPGGIKMARGGIVPGTGNKDTIPALLTPGESVVTKEASQKYGPMIQAMNDGVKIPGFFDGVVRLQAGAETGIPMRLSQGRSEGPINIMAQKVVDDLVASGVAMDDALDRVTRVLTGFAATGEKLTQGGAKRLFEESLLSKSARTPVAAHLTASMPHNDQRTRDAIRQQSAAFQEFARENPQYVRATTKLTALLPGLLNQQMAIRPSSTNFTGATFQDFRAGFDTVGSSNVLANSAEMSDDTIRGDAQAGRALTNMAGVIKERTIAIAHASGSQRVNDNHLIAATQQVIDEYKRLDASSSKVAASSRKVALALERAATTVGQLRVSVPKEEIRRGISSGDYLVRGSSVETQSGVEVARDRGARGASNIPVAGGLATASAQQQAEILTRVMAASGPIVAAAYYSTNGPAMVQGAASTARQMAETQSTILENNTQDIAVISRDRNSPHPIIGKDAVEDAKLYTSTIKQMIMSATPINIPGPMVQPSTPIAPQGTKLPGAGRGQSYNPANNPQGLGTASIPIPIDPKKEMLAIESREGNYKRRQAEEESLQRQQEKSRVVDNRRTNAVKEQIPVIGKETTFIERALQNRAQLEKQKQLNLVAQEEERRGQLRLNAARQREAIRIETMNQRPARGGILDRPIGALRRLAFPNAQDSSLKNLGFDSLNGQVKTAGQLIVESAKEIKKRASASIKALPAEFKKSTEQLLINAKNAGSALKVDFKALGTTIKTNMSVDLEKITSPAIKAANALQKLGASAITAAQKAKGLLSGGVDSRGRTRGQRMAGAGNNAMMGLMGASMAASFLPGQMGELAQKIMPVAGGMMALQMILPMLTSPLGILVLVAGGLAAAFIFLRKSVDDLAKASAVAGSNMGGAANRMEILQEAAGFESPFMRAKDKMFKFDEKEKAGVAEFASYFESESGKKFKEELEKLTNEERYRRVASILAQGIANGMDPEKAKAFGQAIASEVGDAMLNAKLSRDFSNGIFKAGSTAAIDLVKQRQEESKLKISEVSMPDSPLGDALGTSGATNIFGDAAAKIALSMATGPGAILLIPKNILNAKEALEELNKNIETVSKTFGSSIQVLKEVTNAEQLLLEERRNGIIKPEEFNKKSEELQAIEEEQASRLRQAVTLSVDAGATQQSISDQLVVGTGMNADLAGSVARGVDRETVSEQIFGKAFKDLVAAEQDVVGAAVVETLKGITPENAAEKLAKIESDYAKIAKQLVEAAQDGLTQAEFSDLVEKEEVSKFTKDLFSDLYPVAPNKSVEGDSIHAKTAANLMSSKGAFEDLGLSIAEVTVGLQEVSDINVAAEIGTDADKLEDFAKILAGLGELSIAPATVFKMMTEDASTAEVAVAKVKGIVEKISKIKLDKKIFNNATLDAQALTQSLLDAGIQDAPEKVQESVEKAVTNIGKLSDDAFTKFKNIKINADVVTTLFGDDVKNPAGLANVLNDAFPKGLPPAMLPIFLSLMNPEMLTALANLSPAAKAAIEGGATAGTSIVTNEGERFVEHYTLTQNDIDGYNNSVAAIKLAKDFKSGDDSSGTEDDKKGSGGSAKKQKTALQEMISALNATLNLYGTAKTLTKKILKSKKEMNKFFKELSFDGGISDQLRAMNLSETLIADLLSKGGKAAKQIMKALKEKGLKNLDRVLALNTGNKFVDEDTARKRKEEFKATAKTRLEKDGRFTKEEIDKILEDEEKIETIIKFPINKNKDEFNELLAALQNTAKIELLVEPKPDLEKFQEAKDKISEGFDALEQEAVEKSFTSFLAKNASLAESLGKTQKTSIDSGYDLVDAIEKQVNANQRLLDVQQDIVDKKQEEINDHQRANDLIQQGIDDLKRQDEIRNRVSSALSHDLEQMGIAEQKIKDTYDERIKSLDKVESINQRITEQQKGQLNLSRALSEGDIFAATQAAQEMRASNVQFANQNTRDALQQSMENQIDSLVSSDGKTRKQIEAEIASIKEQSYQASLMIRLEEDKIYTNNLLVRNLTNEIYTINETMIEPLQNQNKEFERLLDYRSKDEGFAIRGAMLAGITKTEFEAMAKQTEAQLKPAENLAIALEGVAAAYTNIYNAALKASKAAGSLPGVSVPSTSSMGIPVPGSSDLPFARFAAGGLAPPEPPPRKITSYAMGGKIMNYGMGGKTMKYYKGNVVGTGSRDSIPAMLTPGEYVIRKAMVNKYGSPMFEKINQGSFSMPSFNTGQKHATSSSIKTINNASINAPMYNNYSVSVNVSGTNASADEIANKTIARMKQMQNISIRSSRGY